MKPDTLEFARTVEEIVMVVPRGRVTTYGDVAALAGYPGYARQVGRALASIGMDSGVPCHRVVNSSGRPAPHWASQTALLRAEGVGFTTSGNVDMRRYRWDPSSEAESE